MSHKGWEFHSYLVSKRRTGLTIFEPTDNVVTKCHSAVYGFEGVKSGYFVTVVEKANHLAAGPHTHGSAKKYITKPVFVTEE